MLAEIEDKIADIIREKIADIPRENVVINTKPTKPPAIVISNLKFKFKNSDLSENFDEGKIEFEENFDSDGVKKSYKLQERPFRKSVSVESPPGVVLAQPSDYTVNYDEPSIDFRKAPGKGKRNLIVRYASQKNVMTVKSIKVKALYAVDILGSDRMGADSLAEKVVTALSVAEDQLLKEGFEVKPVGGTTLLDEGGKTSKIQLKYVVEKEIRVKQIVGPIERIEISSKNI
jgi:hypothetical protein